MIWSGFRYCWLGLRKSILSVKAEWWGHGVVVYLIWFAHGPANATSTTLRQASLKIQNGLLLWCQLTQIVMEKRPLNRCRFSFSEVINCGDLLALCGGNRRPGIPPGGLLKSPVGWLPVHWDQLRAQHSATSMGSLYLLYWLYCHNRG